MNAEHQTPTNASDRALGQRDDTIAEPPAHLDLRVDPLRLCINATVALITCLFGPLALLCFALLALRAYASARRAGLLRSKCKLGATRNVLIYLSVLVILAIVATPFWVWAWAQVLNGAMG